MEKYMKGIDQIKKELGEAILNSDEYREYQELQKEIDKNPDLKRVIDEYRKRHFALQYDENIEDKFAATQNLSREYEEFNNQVLVRKYLDAEICLCRQIQDICMFVVGIVDFNMDFLS
jgi:cell fate (sporulation/competence/biofilm development) regulator YlbF (YheA/YmcA/DUF963 family)